MDFIGFVINLVILCVVLAILYWIITLAIQLLPFPTSPALLIVQIIFGLVLLLWLLSYFQGTSHLFYRGRPIVVR